jgi:phosphopantetheinyl transferase (holo-ACP synthase)
LAEITPPGMAAKIDLSLSDDERIAQAIVVISAVALGAGDRG